MDRKAMVAGIIFTLVALFHLVRIYRAILRKEVPPWHVEIEFERVLR